MDLNEASEEIIIDEENNEREFKHRSYIELNDIAMRSGYELKRYNGDHGIFENEKGLIVIIPQRNDIGKRLQIKILKTINNNEI